MRNRELNKKFGRSSDRFRNMLVVVIVLLVSATVFVTMQSSYVGVELVSLEKKESQLIRDNQILSSGIVASTSLNAVKKESISLGFAKPSQTIYLSESKDIGLNINR